MSRWCRRWRRRCRHRLGWCFGAILTPVPEPATYGMLLSGLGLLGALAMRSRQTLPVIRA